MTPLQAPFVLGRVLHSNPHLEVKVVATDRRVDIVAEGLGAGIRSGERLS